MKKFARINFLGEPLSKDFMGIQKGENLNLREETFIFIVLCKVGHLICVKIAKKEIFKKLLCFLSSECFEILRMPQ